MCRRCRFIHNVIWLSPFRYPLVPKMLSLKNFPLFPKPILPCIISTILFVIAMPRPELPYLFAVPKSSWMNISKIYQHLQQLHTVADIKFADCSAQVTIIRQAFFLTLPAENRINLLNQFWKIKLLIAQNHSPRLYARHIQNVTYQRK